MTIEDWRAEIDAIDNEVLRLLNRRVQMAVEVAKLKQAAELPMGDPNRERDVLSRACRANRGPLEDQAVVKLFRAIIRESRRIAIRAFKTANTQPTGDLP